MEDAGGISADPHPQEHVAELGYGGVGEDLLDVVLLERDGRGEERGQGADARHREAPERRQRKENRSPGHQIDSGGDHGGRMDERGDRGRPGHRVREPHMERDLGTLPDRPQEQEQCDRRDDRSAVLECRRGVVEHPGQRGRPREVERPEYVEEQEHGDQEADVADPVHDEGLLARVGLLAVAEPVPDQEIRAQAHSLPSYEQERKARTHHEYEHEEDEEVQIGEVARVAGIVLHVRDAKDVDEEAHPGHDHHHDDAELVELDRGTHVERLRGHPGPVPHDDRIM